MSTGHCTLCTLVLRHRLECSPPVWGLCSFEGGLPRHPGYCARESQPPLAGSHTTAVPVTSSTPLETVGPPCSDHQGTAQEPFWSHRYGVCMPRAWEQRRILSHHSGSHLQLTFLSTCLSLFAWRGKQYSPPGITSFCSPSPAHHQGYEEAVELPTIRAGQTHEAQIPELMSHS